MNRILQHKQVHLHTIILLWGLTPVLGKFISIQALDLVWFRLLFAGISLGIYVAYKRYSLRFNLKQLAVMLLMGCVVGAHWFFFYHAIKVSNVSVALSGFATVTLFGSLLQPLLLRKPFFAGDVVYGLVIMVGLLIIVNAESVEIAGIIYGVLAAFTGAVFSIYNGKLIENHAAPAITLMEFAGAFLFISLVKFPFNPELPSLSSSDMWALLVLSILCTTVAFTWSIEILKYFQPLYVIITNNLEPVYGIVFSYWVFGASEHMSATFYSGALIILISVFTYPLIQRRFTG